jgi:hypothetical protein
VFADGYFVGIVNDFDGMFQHLNLEAASTTSRSTGAATSRWPSTSTSGPGETTTFHAEVLTRVGDRRVRGALRWALRVLPPPLQRRCQRGR